MSLACGPPHENPGWPDSRAHTLKCYYESPILQWHGPRRVTQLADTPWGELPEIATAEERHQQLPCIEWALRAGHGAQHDLFSPDAGAVGTRPLPRRGHCGLRQPGFRAQPPCFPALWPSTSCFLFLSHGEESGWPGFLDSSIFFPILVP